MIDIDEKKVCEDLNLIMQYELAGVVRYTHYALMVAGANRIPVVDFFRQQAQESLLHAQQAGEILSGLGGHPHMGIAALVESHRHETSEILKESLEHERQACSLYNRLLKGVEGKSVYLEEYARGMIGTEELHVLELRKMLRDFDTAWENACEMG